MNYLSICSGIEAASVAWHPLGWKPLAFSEIEPFPSAVLAHHWPEVPNLGDMTKHHEWNEETQSTCGIVQDDKAPLEFQNTLRHDAGAMGDDDGKTESSLCPLLMSDGSTSSGSRSRERSSEGNIVSSVQHQIASSGGRRMDDAGACLPIRKRIKFSEIDVLVGGTPCQAFSVAGLRNSLSDERGNLTLIYVNILNQIDEARNLAGRPPAICLWENVPGVLTTKDNAFGCFLGALAGEDIPLEPPGGKWKNTGYVRGPQRTIAWRILDAQYFGVAQRRRRVFVVASARDGFSPEQILFEFTGLRRDIAPSREAGKGTAASAERSTQPVFLDRAAFNQGANAQFNPVIRQDGISDALVARGPHAVASRMVAFGEYVEDGTASTLTLKQRDYKDATDLVTTQYGAIAGSLTARHDSSPCADRGQNVVCVHGTQDPCTDESLAFALGRNSGQENVVAFPINTQLGLRGAETSNSPREGIGIGQDGDPAFTLQRAHSHGVVTTTAVRRLTPTECERLQGFPDGHSLIPWRNKPADQCPDGPRYKALGNSMAVPCMRWLGERIQLITDLCNSKLN